MAELVEVRYLRRKAHGLVERSASGPAEAADLALFARRPGERPLLDLTREAPHEYRLLAEEGQEPRLEPVLGLTGFDEALTVVGAVSWERMRRLLLEESKERLLPELARERASWESRP